MFASGLLAPVVDSGIDADLYHLLVGRSVEGKVNVVDITGAEAQRVRQIRIVLLQALILCHKNAYSLSFFDLSIAII